MVRNVHEKAFEVSQSTETIKSIDINNLIGTSVLIKILLNNFLTF